MVSLKGIMGAARLLLGAVAVATIAAPAIKDISTLLITK